MRGRTSVSLQKPLWNTIISSKNTCGFFCVLTKTIVFHYFQEYMWIQFISNSIFHSFTSFWCHGHCTMWNLLLTNSFAHLFPSPLFLGVPCYVTDADFCCGLQSPEDMKSYTENVEGSKQRGPFNCCSKCFVQCLREWFQITCRIFKQIPTSHSSIWLGFKPCFYRTKK